MLIHNYVFVSGWELLQSVKAWANFMIMLVSCNTTDVKEELVILQVLCIE